MKTSDKIDNGHSYDLICDEWQKFRDTTVINKCIVDFVEYLIPNGNILDVGCGTGYPIAQYLVSRNFFVTGIDISQEMINKANRLRLKNSVFIKQDVLNFSSDILFDGVIAFDSLWHVAKENQIATYRKISSLMKQGAYFIFTHGNRNDETVGTMFNQKFYYSALKTEEIVNVFAEVGLKAVSVIENYKEQTTGERDLLVIAQKI